MAIVRAEPNEQGWLSRVMTTDFCPWANRFVYWLKEPIGWFALATAVSALIGLYFSPIGWTLAASLTAIMVIGMVWPWVAVRVTRCGLHPENDAVHEGTSCRMVFSVCNRIPLPVWGLAVEGYLDCESMDESIPTVGLACVPPLCTADYAVEVTPEFRGHYPVSIPQVACSFPFGIWTARRPVGEVKPLTVWPMVYHIAGMPSLTGLTNADDGDGSRGGQSGDFVGVRAFRRGDSFKHVNWVASARSDSIIVTERGGPQTVTLDVFVDTRSHADRETLARQIRVAASVLSSLHQSRIETRVRLGDRRLVYKLGAAGKRKMLDALARIPANGEDCSWNAPTGTTASVRISGSPDGSVRVTIFKPGGSRQAGGGTREFVINRHDDMATALASLWQEVRDANLAA